MSEPAKGKPVSVGDSMPHTPAVASASQARSEQGDVWRRYGVVVALTVVAIILMALLSGMMGWEGSRIPFALFFGVVMYATWYGGRAPGLFSIILSALVAAYFFIVPVHSLRIGFEGWLQVGVFLLVASLISYLTEKSKRAESAAQSNRERLSTTLRSIGDAVITTDAEGRVTFMNPVAQNMTGWRETEAQGRQLSEVFRIVNEETRDLMDSPVATVLEKGTVVGLANHTLLLAKDGREIPVEDSGAPIVDARGRITGVVLVFHDVTEKRRAEQSLRESEDRFRIMADHAPVLIWVAGTDKLCYFFNKTWLEFTGRTSEQEFGDGWMEGVHPDDFERCLRVYTTNFDARRSFAAEYRLRRHDGEYRWVLSNGVPRFSPDGSFIGFIGSCIDISDRKLTEEKLDALLASERVTRAEAEASEERYRYLAETMPQIIWTARPDGWLDYYNQRWYEYTGMTPEETEGWGWQPVIHPEDVERCLKGWATAVKTGRNYEIEYRFRRASDSSYRWHLGRAMPLRDGAGNIVKWFGSATDIDDQKRAVEKLSCLAEASELLASSLDYMTTIENLTRLVVPRIADWCTIDIIEEDGTTHRLMAHANPVKAELAREMNRRYPPRRGLAHGLSKVIESGRSELYLDMTEELLAAMAHDKEHLEMMRELGAKSTVCVPLIARGRTFGAIALASAESGRRYGQPALAFAEDLARLIALTIDNARLFQHTEEANRAKDEFLATLSHELRTPLTPVIGWVHMMRAGQLSDSDISHGLTVIDKNSQSLARLINDLLDMSAIMSGKMRIERMPVVLSSVLTEAIETVRAEADKRSIRIDIEYTPRLDDATPLTISGDRTRLVQVFWNLLNNAVKFSVEGGRVRVACDHTATKARIHVEDQGRGIPPEFLPYVFDRFRQADASTTRAYGGLGIGLALVKSFVEAHGGTVAAASDGNGHGSRFTITLPLLRAKQTAEIASTDDHDRTQDATTRPVGSVRRVLIVEDANDTLEMLQAIFERQGFETTLCETGAEALRIAASMWFDIIVSDIGLPQIDGYELLKRLRQMPHLRNTPAVALTGYATKKDAEAAYLAGFDLHIPKPVDPTVLTDSLEKLIEQKAHPPG
ncbi:MAG TPA: PAS domain S-box protein [Pyrinomonadaceae bacterium]|jgi:PAS domain S-box-containing protein